MLTCFYKHKKEISHDADDQAEIEMSQIYECTQSYLDLIKDRPETPPTPLYFTQTSEVEINLYEEPVKELMIEPESRESTPEYQSVPVKALINTFEQGKSGITSSCLF